MKKNSYGTRAVAGSGPFIRARCAKENSYRGTQHARAASKLHLSSVQHSLHGATHPRKTAAAAAGCFNAPREQTLRVRHSAKRPAPPCHRPQTAQQQAGRDGLPSPRKQIGAIRQNGNQRSAEGPRRSGTTHRHHRHRAHRDSPRKSRHARLHTTTSGMQTEQPEHTYGPVPSPYPMASFRSPA